MRRASPRASPLMLLDRSGSAFIRNEYSLEMNVSLLNSSAWRAESALISAGFALIFLLGTVGNSLVLAVLFRSGQMKTKTTNLFILNLAIADLCFIVFCVPFQATIYTLDEWVFGPAVCKVVHFIIFLTMYASIFTLTAVSVDRCTSEVYMSCIVGCFGAVTGLLQPGEIKTLFRSF